jgi:hypothetical protein
MPYQISGVTISGIDVISIITDTVTRIDIINTIEYYLMNELEMRLMA